MSDFFLYFIQPLLITQTPLLAHSLPLYSAPYCHPSLVLPAIQKLLSSCTVEDCSLFLRLLVISPKIRLLIFPVYIKHHHSEALLVLLLICNAIRTLSALTTKACLVSHAMGLMPS